MEPNNEQPSCIVYKGIAARTRLRELGVPSELLVEAAQQGYVERQNAEPPFDPPTAAGTDAWRYTVRVLRKGLDDRDWRIANLGNLPLVISNDRKIHIAVSSGDEFTGVEAHRLPRSKNPKGVLTAGAITRNSLQFDLFPEGLPETLQKFDSTIQHSTWLFLFYITDDKIRAELSLPNSMDDSGHVDGWAERILISVPRPGDEQIDETDIDQGPDIRPVVTSKV